METCPECGKQISSLARICPHCGIGGAELTQARSSRSSGIGCLLLLLGLGWLYSQIS